MDKKAHSSASSSAALSAPWSVPVTGDDIPESGLHRDIDAPAATCAGVAALAEVREVSRLSASFDLTRRGAGVHVVGRVTGKVGQTCVVSLEPIESEVDEAIDLTFAPQPAGTVAEPKSATRKRAKPGEEPPEPMIDGIVDLGVIATEFLILGIDPYPRKAGVEFTPPKVAADAPHPFAALKVLKKSPGDGQR